MDVRALPGKESREPPGRQPVPRGAAAEDQRRRILAATAEVVAEQGYQEMTIEAIVRGAKVGYKTFYKHYPDKDAAFNALIDVSLERTITEVEAAYERTDGPWEDRIAAALGALFAEVAAHPAEGRACLVEAVAAGPETAAKHQAALRRLAPLRAPGRGVSPHKAPLPEKLEETIAGGIVWVLGQRLVAGEAEQLRGLLPETIEFVLRPFVGEQRAAQEADEGAATSSA